MEFGEVLMGAPVQRVVGYRVLLKRAECFLKLKRYDDAIGSIKPFFRHQTPWQADAREMLTESLKEAGEEGKRKIRAFLKAHQRPGKAE